MDRPGYSSVTIGGIYVRSTAMRPNNNGTTHYLAVDFNTFKRMIV